MGDTAVVEGLLDASRSDDGSEDRGLSQRGRGAPDATAAQDAFRLGSLESFAVVADDVTPVADRRVRAPKLTRARFRRAEQPG